MPKRKTKPGAEVEPPEPRLTSAGRCGRWKRDGYRTAAGRPTRKAEARARILAGEEPQAILDEYFDAGARCGHRAKKGRPCWLHGDRSPTGAEAAGYVHGRYRVPRILRAAFEAFLAQPDVADLSSDLALSKALTQTQVDAWGEEGDAPAWRQRVLRCVREVEGAMRNKGGSPREREARFDSAWRALLKLVRRGASQEEGAAAMSRQLSVTARLARADVIRRRQSETMVPVEVVVAVVYELRDGFREALEMVEQGSSSGEASATLHKRLSKVVGPLAAAPQSLKTN